MSLYPNPSRGSFKVALENVKDDQILNIHNMQGVLVQSAYISADDSQRTFEFDLSNLENGMYIVELSSDTQRTTQQLIIQN